MSTINTKDGVEIFKTCHGFPHGMPATRADTINAGLLAFIQS